MQSHNLEVAGSNPVPAISKALREQGFFRFALSSSFPFCAFLHPLIHRGDLTLTVP